MGLLGKRILIRVDGSHSIGMGHIYRMKTLALALQQAGSQVAFLTKIDEVANNLLNTAGIASYVFQTDSYSSVLRKAIDEQKPHLIIQDILETTSELMRLLKDTSPAKIVNLDDVGAGLVMADVAINSIVFHWGKYKKDDCQAQVFEGPQYMILQPEVSRYINSVPKIPDEIQNILLAFGGTDTHYVTERVLPAIDNIEKKLSIKINLGPGSHLSPVLKEAVQKSIHQIDLMHSIPSLLKEFSQADLVICGGGNILYELAALGIPSVSIATEKHEILNTNYWSGIGTTISLGWEKTLTYAKISETVGSLLANKEQRREMSKLGKETVDDMGLVRVVKIIKMLAEDPRSPVGRASG